MSRASRCSLMWETVVAGVYSRSIGLNGAHGAFSIGPVAGDALEVMLDFPDPAAVPEIVALLRRMFDLDADLPAIHQQLAVDPLMARLIASRPGLRVPGAWNGLAWLRRCLMIRICLSRVGRAVCRGCWRCTELVTGRRSTLRCGSCPDEKSEQIPAGLKLRGCPAT